MKIKLIAAVAENGIIGKENGLPWVCSRSKDSSTITDLEYFKAVTLGKPVIMGRSTYDSLKNRPLKNRLNIVLTKDKESDYNDVLTAHSFRDAMTFLRTINAPEVFIIGGSSVYEDALEYGCDELYITHMNFTVEGDTEFPNWPECLEDFDEFNRVKCGSMEFTIYHKPR